MTQPAPPLIAAADKAVEKIQHAHPEQLAQWPAERLPELRKVLGCSDFVSASIIRDGQLLPWLAEHVDDKEHVSHYRQQLADKLAAATDENSLMRLLRAFRRQEMVWIAWRDFTGKASLAQSLQHLSQLAEALIMEAYNWLYIQCSKEWGTPMNAQGEAQPMLILGMGKLGGGELNFSSDIDLIFTYPENGETQGGRRSLANAQFFTRLGGQRLIKALDQQTYDGFCYRVDMRLRPVWRQWSFGDELCGTGRLLPGTRTGLGTLCDDQSSGDGGVRVSASIKSCARCCALLCSAAILTSAQSSRCDG